MSHIQYLAIGHITDDLTDTGIRAGGTVTYSGHTAQALGYQTAVLTTHTQNPHPALTGLDSHILPTTTNTTFRNVYTANGRQQTVHHTAPTIQAAQVPTHWHTADIVHIAPVFQDVADDLFDLFPHRFVGLTPQGFMRQRLPDGTVRPAVWEQAEKLLGCVTAVVLSQEDLPTPDYLNQLQQWASLLVVTQGKQGCIVYHHQTSQHIPSPTVTEIDPTGAGDIFAATFFIHYHQTKDPYQAAYTANQIAAATVQETDLTAKLQQIRAFAP